MAIHKLDTKEALKTIKSLKSKKRFVHGTKGQDLKLLVQIKNVSNRTQSIANALIDSGATGSCINREYAKKNGHYIWKLPLKMPVYNADGTLNADGSIEGFVEVRMTIGDHSEKIELAVTNLGKMDIFLGLDWL